jgi:hypothetical protein
VIDLDELEKLEKAATPGLWTPVSDGNKYAIAAGDRDIFTSENRLYRTFDKKHGACFGDASLVCAMHNALPELIAELRAARKVIEDARGIDDRLIELALDAYDEAVKGPSNV